MMKDFGPALIIGGFALLVIGGVGALIYDGNEHEFRLMSACLEAEMQWIDGDCVK